MNPIADGYSPLSGAQTQIPLRRKHKMPAKSDAQRKLFQIAEHNPDALQQKNKKILGSMPKSTMHEFASTKGKLPKKVKAY